MDIYSLKMMKFVIVWWIGTVAGFLMTNIQPVTAEAFDASKVIAKGPGLERNGVTVNKWTEFTVDVSKAGKASLKIQCIDDNYNQVNIEVVDKRDGTYECRYYPKNPIQHTIIITYGSVGIPSSPFTIHVNN